MAIRQLSHCDLLHMHLFTKTRNTNERRHGKEKRGRRSRAGGWSGKHCEDLQGWSSRQTLKWFGEPWEPIDEMTSGSLCVWELVASLFYPHHHQFPPSRAPSLPSSEFLPLPKDQHHLALLPFPPIWSKPQRQIT